MEVIGAVSAAFPMVLFLVDNVLGHLKVLNKGGSSSVKANEYVEELKKRFWTFQASIKEEEKRRGGSSSTSCSYLSQDFVKQIRDLAFEIEDALDQFMFQTPQPSHNSTTKQFRKAVKVLSSQRENIVKKMESLLEPKLHKDRLRVSSGVGTSTEGEPLKTDQMLVDDEIVGYKKSRKDLVHQLIKGDDDHDQSKRVTIQVIGPGGSGKTFLVKKVYQKTKVVENFDCRAWIRGTHSFKLEELLLDMLNQFCSARDEQIFNEVVGNIEQKLQRYLQGKKYLIVLDDVWNKQGYTPIVNSLPSSSAGSRIVITTRRYDVVDKSDYTHKLQGLCKEEAWRLFCRHAFRGTTSQGILCPEDLKESAEKIIEKCNLFPLHVAVVGNLMSKKLPCKKQWENSCKSLGCDIRHSGLPIINLVLQTSFMDLPDYLKNCFLYFGIFPEGCSIKRGRLIRCWVAEGFVEERSGKELEEVAEAYLNELIERSLVQVSELSVDGRVRSCKVVRLYHEFIVWLSREVNFVAVMDQMNTGTISPGEKVRRISVHEVAPQLSQINESIKQCVRSFFMFGQQEVSQRKNLLHKFGLLKVLDLQGVPALNKFHLEDHIGGFLLLRCLNLRQTNIKRLPSSIKKLTLLESLDLRSTLVTELPKWIYQLAKLRHLLVSCFDSEEVAKTSPGGEAKGVKVSNGNIKALSSLQKVSLIKVINNEIFIKGLGSLEQLTKLGLANLKTEFGSKLCDSVEKMKNLSTLDLRAMEDQYLDLDEMKNPPNHVQRLYLSGRLVMQRLPRWLCFRSVPSLVKVVLERSKLDVNQNPFEGLETLPCLMELKMVDYYTGTRLVFKAKTFKRLKKLHIEQFDKLTEVMVENEAITSLKKLTICNCKKLEPLPRSYTLGHLEEFDVDEINDDFINDVKRRRKEGELVQIPIPISSTTDLGSLVIENSN